MAQKIYKLLFVIAAIGFGACLVGVYGYYQIYRKAKAEYDSLGREVVITQAAGDQSSQQPVNQAAAAVQAENEEAPPALFIDFSRLKEINKDAAAWIDFPGQGISYPVAAGEDNAYYLNHTFRGNESSVGCIFADCRNSEILTDDNTILYGHNMKNGSMFGMLNRYEKEAYYKQYSFFDIYTPQETYRCRIVAACQMEAEGGNFPVEFETAEARSAFVQRLKAGTGYGTVSLSEESGGGPLVMLSTCVGEDYEHRMVILAEAFPWK